MNASRFVRSAAVLLFALAIAAGGCGPDLTVDPSVAVQYEIDFGAQRATAHIANVGNRDAGSFLVYLEISDPTSAAAVRPECQATESVAGLGVGATHTVTVALADFSARRGSGFDPSTITSGLLEVRIDPKAQVDERDEANNYYCGVY